VDMHATDLVGINGITRVLLVYTCQQGVYPRGHVLPLRLPVIKTVQLNIAAYTENHTKPIPTICSYWSSKRLVHIATLRFKCLMQGKSTDDTTTYNNKYRLLWREFINNKPMGFALQRNNNLHFI
jgi:hypothetical protein